METAAPAANTPQDNAPNSRGGHRGGRGGRGGGNRDGGHRGGRGGDGASSQRGQGRGRGSRGPRRGRGGHQDGGRGQANGDQNEHTTPPNAQTISVPGPRPDPLQIRGDAEDAASESDQDICFICAEVIQYHAITPCNHQTCHVCALRMRALYKKKECSHCRTEAAIIIFSKGNEKKFDEFTDDDIVAENPSLGIKFDSQDIVQHTTQVLQYNCPDASCEKVCRSWPDMHHHVKAVHKMVLCDLCVRHKKVFTHEHQLFTPAELKKHEKYGDNVLGSETQSGFTGHPECEFCRKRFYSDDELYQHCREAHERCHVCDRLRPGHPVYFANYPKLEEHFQREHYACMEPECLEKHFVVFENEIDLKAHQLEVHPNGLSKEARRAARQIDMSNFQHAHTQPDRNRRERRTRDATRGHQDPLEQPIRTEQNMSRAEIAYHRQLAIQSAQSTTRRTFGGQLTEPARPEPARPTPAVAPVRPVSTPPVAPNAFPPLGAASSSRPTSTPATDAARLKVPMSDEVRRLKHTAVIERARQLLHGDEHKMNIFRTYISTFRAGKMSGSALVDNFWGLFDATTTALGTLVQELAELFEDEARKRELLKAWNDWKAINEDYPPIAGGTHSTVPAAPASSILKIKSSTARSGRSAMAQKSSWGTASSSYAPAASYNPTPAEASKRTLATPSVASSSSANLPTNLWVPLGTSTRPPSVQVVPASSRPTPTVAGSSGPRPTMRRDEFPGLPPKKTVPGWTPVQKKTNTWNPPPPPNAWNPGQGSGSGGAGENAQENAGAEGSAGAGSKKKGKQKQILFKVGL